MKYLLLFDYINLTISNNLSTGMIWIYPCVLKPTVLVYNYIVEEEEKSIFYPMIHGYQSFHVIFTYVTDLLFLLSLHMIPYHVYRLDSQFCENLKSLCDQAYWKNAIFAPKRQLEQMQFCPKAPAWKIFGEKIPET